MTPSSMLDRWLSRSLVGITRSVSWKSSNWSTLPWSKGSTIFDGMTKKWFKIKYEAKAWKRVRSFQVDGQPINLVRIDSTGPSDKSNSEQDGFAVEYAKSSRSLCQTCQKKIDKDSVRLSQRSSDGDRWFHVDCFKSSKDEISFKGTAETWDFLSGLIRHSVSFQDDLFLQHIRFSGFNELNKEDQNELKKKFGSTSVSSRFVSTNFECARRCLRFSSWKTGNGRVTNRRTQTKKRKNSPKPKSREANKRLRSTRTNKMKLDWRRFSLLFRQSKDSSVNSFHWILPGTKRIVVEVQRRSQKRSSQWCSQRIVEIQSTEINNWRIERIRFIFQLDRCMSLLEF